MHEALGADRTSRDALVSFLLLLTVSTRQTKQGQFRTTNQPEGKVAQKALRAVPDRAAFSFTTLLLIWPPDIDNYLLRRPFQNPTRVVAIKIIRRFYTNRFRSAYFGALHFDRASYSGLILTILALR
jgi:hypothetical protein